MIFITFWKSWYHHSTVESLKTKIIRIIEFINWIFFILRFERATWQGKTKLLPAERKRAGLRDGGSRKQGVSLSSIDVKLLQNNVVVDDDDIN